MSVCLDPFACIFEEAKKAADSSEVPVGAAIFKEGRLISASGNRMRSQNDPTAHAELLVIRQACETLNTPYLLDCALYVTLEPCTLCAAAISFARLKRVYFCASDPKRGGIENGVRFYDAPTCHHRPEVYSGFHAEEAGALLVSFFQERRRAKRIRCDSIKP